MREPPPRVLLVGGLDPSGGAGLAADARALASADVFARPVASCLTVQDSRGVSRVEPVASELVRASIRAALADGVDAVKIGLVPDAATGRAIASAVPHGLAVVVDPVQDSTSGDPLGALDAYPLLLARATLATPNAAEARALAGESDPAAAAERFRKMGARNVLVKGGDEPGPRVRDLLFDERGGVLTLEAARVDAGPVRGSGCTLAALAAAHLAQGYDVREASVAAVEETRSAIVDAFRQPGAAAVRPGRSLLPDARSCLPEARGRMAAVAAAWRELAPMLPRAVVPEVGANLSFLPEDGDPARAAALSARFVRSGTGSLLASVVELGGIHHTARVAAAAFRGDPSKRAALNLRLRRDLVDAARAEGLLVMGFDRASQPPDAPSSVEWGTRDATLRLAGRVPDVVFDEGALGKEPMLRILAEDPSSVVVKVRVLLARAKAFGRE